MKYLIRKLLTDERGERAVCLKAEEGKGVSSRWEVVMEVVVEVVVVVVRVAGLRRRRGWMSQRRASSW